MISLRKNAATPHLHALKLVVDIILSSPIPCRVNPRTRVEAVKGCRGVGKKDMKLNDKLPKIAVDPETYEV